MLPTDFVPDGSVDQIQPIWETHHLARRCVIHLWVFFGGASMTKLNVTSFFFFLHFARKMFILQYISGVFALEQCENKRLKNIFNLQMFGLEGRKNKSWTFFQGKNNPGMLP